MAVAPFVCEVKTFEVTQRVARKFEGLFLGHDLVQDPHRIVTLAFKTKHRASAMSAEMLAERNEMFALLIARMQAFRRQLSADGMWCDFIDPSCGAPFYTDSPTTMIECDERYRQLGFQVLELGCCRCLANESFGQCVVMTSAFVQADEATIFKNIEHLTAGYTAATVPAAPELTAPTTSTPSAAPPPSAGAPRSAAPTALGPKQAAPAWKAALARIFGGCLPCLHRLFGCVHMNI